MFDIVMGMAMQRDPDAGSNQTGVPPTGPDGLSISGDAAACESDRDDAEEVDATDGEPAVDAEDGSFADDSDPAEDGDHSVEGDDDSAADEAASDDDAADDVADDGDIVEEAADEAATDDDVAEEADAEAGEEVSDGDGSADRDGDPGEDSGSEPGAAERLKRAWEQARSRAADAAGKVVPWCREHEVAAAWIGVVGAFAVVSASFAIAAAVMFGDSTSRITYDTRIAGSEIEVVPGADLPYLPLSFEGIDLSGYPAVTVSFHASQVGEEALPELAQGDVAVAERGSEGTALDIELSAFSFDPASGWGSVSYTTTAGEPAGRVVLISLKKCSDFRGGIEVSYEAPWV